MKKVYQMEMGRGGWVGENANMAVCLGPWTQTNPTPS